MPLWEPPSPEIESLLFAVQAALGAGVLGYYFGRRRGLAEGRGLAAGKGLALAEDKGSSKNRAAH